VPIIVCESGVCLHFLLCVFSAQLLDYSIRIQICSGFFGCFGLVGGYFLCGTRQRKRSGFSVMFSKWWTALDGMNIA
jgi:hypothetical protein